MSENRRTQAAPFALHWSHVRPVLVPWKWHLIGAATSVAAGAALALLPPLVLRRLIDDNLSQGRAEGLFGLALLYLGATISVHVTTFATSYTTSVAAQGALRRLRVHLFEHLLALPISYYDRSPIGDAISRCTSDMATIESLFSSGVINVLAQALRLVAALAALVALSPALSLVLFLSLPLLVVLTRTFQVRMRDAQRALRLAMGRLNANLQETLTRVEVVRAFHWEHRIVQRCRRVLAETLFHQNYSTALGAVYDPLLKVLQSALVAGFLLLSVSPLLERLNLTVGTLTAFIMLFDQFFDPLLSLGRDWQVVQGALAGLERVFEILSLSTHAEVSASAAKDRAAFRDGEEASPADALVQVDGVTFGYFEDTAVLSDVSLTVAPGQHVAIVGRTGAGKSSLFQLLGGLYDSWEGNVRVRGLDPAAVPPEARRRIIGAVPQVVWLFGGTVLDNLTLGDDDLGREAVEGAARITGAEAFIEALPEGYDTFISDTGRGRGSQLSAGQRQLLALTRALVGGPVVLLLDEATAAVDSATEAAFKGALRIHLERRDGAVITIAHRLSTAMEADCIVVLEDGRILEQGSPEVLIAAGGHLAGLWELENAGWEWR